MRTRPVPPTVVRLALLVVLFCAISAFKWTGGKPPCEQAEEWVVANLRLVPTTYAGLKEFDPTYRRAIYRHSAQAVRVAFWHGHLQYYLDPARGLTRSQRALVAYADAHIAEFTSPSKGSQASADDAKLKASVRATFSRRLGAQIFTALGPEQATSTYSLTVDQASVVSGSIALFKTLASAVGITSATQTGINCQCAVGDDWCWSTCHRTPSCDYAYTSCGWWLAATCDGLCW